MTTARVLERRGSRDTSNATAVELMKSQVSAAEHQLAIARDHLIAARRRVGALQDVVHTWKDFARLVDRAADRAHRERN